LFTDTNFFVLGLFALKKTTITAMGFIKGALFGMAVYAVVQHITKRDLITGRSLLDDFLEKAPTYIEQAKDISNAVKEEFTEPSSHF